MKAALLAVPLAVAVLAVGIGVIWSVSKAPVHKDAASVSSTAGIAPTGHYTGAAEDARRLARALVARDDLPGLSVAVAVDGEIAWAEGFGWADVDSRTPLTPRTRFRLGALSKPLTAMAAARLRDQGRLDLDAPVQRYVRDYPDKAWPLTARQLLGDVAGVHRIRGDNNDAMPTTHCDRLDEAVALLADEPLLFEPGTQHRYSTWGWVLVSAAVQGAAGQPFGRFMDREVFQPLGMTRTVVEETESLVDVAHGPGGGPDYSCLAGGGAFLSTPTDLVRLGSAMLKPGFLRADTIADFQRPTRLASGASTTYALGWTVASTPLAGAPVRVVSHRGSPAGGTVSLLAFPDLGLAVAIAANVADAKGVGPLALQIAEAFARQHKKPIEQTRRRSPPSNGPEDL
ncbi:MAG: serine hydrolase domain-containing protein [Vicinamibacteraceae bacterium]